jgi:hypothetical protein
VRRDRLRGLALSGQAVSVGGVFFALLVWLAPAASRLPGWLSASALTAVGRSCSSTVSADPSVGAPRAAWYRYATTSVAGKVNR